MMNSNFNPNHYLSPMHFIRDNDFRKYQKFLLYILTFICLSSSLSHAQELEPRALTNIPVGMNFAFAGYAFGNGNILFDSSLPLEDTKANLHTAVIAYLRSINLFGLSAKVDAVVPYGIGDWTGIYTGIDTATSRSGFGDLKVRISFNFLGAPALKAKDFGGYKPELISGLSLQITAPTGQYNPDKLINLGSNRWVFKPQWGLSKNYSKWILETYASIWFFTKNTDFFGGNELKQNPLYALKIHGIRKFNNKSWLALDAGYGIGAVSKINDELKDSRISTFRFGATYALTLTQKSTLRFSAITAVRIEKGPDFDALSVSYQYRWIKNKPEK